MMEWSESRTRDIRISLFVLVVHARRHVCNAVIRWFEPSLDVITPFRAHTDYVYSPITPDQPCFPRLLLSQTQLGPHAIQDSRPDRAERTLGPDHRVSTATA